MSIRSRSKGWSSVAVISWRGLTQRYLFILLMLAAAGLIVMGRVRPTTIDNARIHAIDTIAPVLDALTRPVTALGHVASNVTSYVNLRSENEQLRTTNTRLRDWQTQVVALERENTELRRLLNFKAEPGLAYISARVIADTGGAFTRGLIVTAGKLDGVREGMAAMTGNGLVGRVVEAGDWSSRVLLITDLNSRIPVTITGSNDRAILAGDNSSTPDLLYMPQDAAPTPNAAVVTSGHGGVFPPNLPVGQVVAGHNKGEYKIIPAADIGRIDYVRLIDFNLRGGAFNPVATKIDAETRAPSH
jgi:rod shape-determining protein MreC